ncbi:MAG TPA: energy transducer TonB [Candidatus Angelobacter sp.]|nr:energy transducer TonB [Candidatus Angelobacter sp.]
MKHRFAILMLFAVLAFGGQSKGQQAEQPKPQPQQDQPSTQPQEQSPQDQKPKPLKLRVSSGVLEANLVRKVQPSYPLEALRQHIQGDVVLQVLIGKKGNVEKCRPVSGDAILVEAAKEAVELWQYKPTTLNGEPVQVESTVTVRFHM